MLETKEEEEHREYQGTGGIQVTFAQPFKKKKKRVSNYRKPGGNTFQELKIIWILKNYVSGMWEVIATPIPQFYRLLIFLLRPS